MTLCQQCFLSLAHENLTVAFFSLTYATQSAVFSPICCVCNVLLEMCEVFVVFIMFCSVFCIRTEVYIYSKSSDSFVDN